MIPMTYRTERYPALVTDVYTESQITATEYRKAINTFVELRNSGQINDDLLAELIYLVTVAYLESKVSQRVESSLAKRLNPFRFESRRLRS